VETVACGGVAGACVEEKQLQGPRLFGLVKPNHAAVSKKNAPLPLPLKIQPNTVTHPEENRLQNILHGEACMLDVQIQSIRNTVTTEAEASLFVRVGIHSRTF
jgi:hypothetical protein